MKKIALLSVIAILICLNSCKNENNNSISIDADSLSLKSFSALIGEVEYKGILSYKGDDVLKIVINNPKELSGIEFLIDQNGITCLEGGVSCTYGVNELDDDFVFDDLFNLIKSSLNDGVLIKNGDGYIFSIDNNTVYYDIDGVLLSAKINGTEIKFT